ncbi:hypothetical protein [Cesiribacter sp. SM1]|uniref:hypothetical protein n=1 Tax=Cesiribacter sp. SM1 TaxID=2861196 RepID=UPI001CD6D671|nr:hypothetical protein [Cesiribacter sp. SM1]
MRRTLLFALLLLCAPAMAKVESSLTERIGLGEASQLVPEKKWALEAGVNFALNRSSIYRNSTYGLPSLLIRRRVNSFSEFRIATEYLVSSQLDETSLERGESLAGLNYLSFGGKLALVNEGKQLPQTGLIVMLGLMETGSRHYELSETQLSFRLLSDKTLDARNTLSLNSGISSTAGSKGWQGDNTLTFGCQATEKVEVFAEAWNAWLQDYHELGVNLGMFIRPVPHLKLELVSGLGYDGNTPKFYLNGGIAFETN